MINLREQNRIERIYAVKVKDNSVLDLIARQHGGVLLSRDGKTQTIVFPCHASASCFLCDNRVRKHFPNTPGKQT